jgi:hypothetical protein
MPASIKLLLAARRIMFQLARVFAPALRVKLKPRC